jgi:hypothetical protein
MKPATAKARDLREKLQALVDRGVNGEKLAAEQKLARLVARFDWSAPDTRTADLFAGTFQRANQSVPVWQFTGETFTVAPSVKWALETATGISCVFHERELLAEATPKTAKKLSGIAATITESFVNLWAQFHQAGANPADRNTFTMGLYDGMMNETRPALLPGRACRPAASTPRRAKKRAVTVAPGLSLHPYSVAVTLGQRIRFNVPLNLIAEELGATLAKQIT